MFDTLIKNIEDFIEKILICFRIKKKEKYNNFYYSDFVNNYEIDHLINS